mmetsp:Transcript_19790/g.29634  ORF Transcript_19790/g.29634 Transcript_19790/m.29634 type:complete len:528 (-) Transcript_19790:11-1594(-)
MNTIDKYLPTEEWAMCSEEEAVDRQRFNELSLLESTIMNRSSSKAHPKERIPHPKRCVKKYRRSAAGGGVITNGTEVRRNIHKLEATVNYLLGVIFPAQSSSPSAQPEDIFRVSLLQSVLFVDDRIRAVQVDLTTLLGEGITVTTIRSVRHIQAKILRYHLLSQYLLSNLSSKKYEWKFGHKALTTAISSYLSTWSSMGQELEHDVHENSDADIAQLDEIISYITLLHVASILYSREPSIQSYTSAVSQQQKFCGLACEDGNGMSAILGLFRKYCPKKERRKIVIAFPKYQWSLKIASDVENGNYLSLIRFFKSTPRMSEQNQVNSINDNTRWKIIARCCVAQVMPVIRIGLLRLYNKSFMKQEKVKDHDLARLLCLANPKSAIQFCQNVGLPALTLSTAECIVMKAAPICIQEGENIIRQLTNPGRDEDFFVVGPFHNQWLSKKDSNKMSGQRDESTNDEFDGMSSLQRAMAKAKISKQKKAVTPTAKSCFDNEWAIPGVDNYVSRVDEDGVEILPSSVMRQLIFQ